MKRLIGALGATCLLVVSGCAANPGPPPVVEEPAEETQSSTPEETPPPEEDEALSTERSTVAIGVDPLQGGLNPHLVANNSQLVSDIADLVLPSPFHRGQMDTDILEAAEEVEAPEGVAQRVRYTIASPAQWSDGTPLTGADFTYLWQSMISTPGTNSPAGYHAISAINTTAGGRVITVDFSERVRDWRLLFQHLLPSHLLQDDDFPNALSSDIPASAGVFQVDSVDRGRGVITLNRNDRFWGENPALVDVIELHFIRSTGQAVNMLRSGQIGFADFIPQQTSLESLNLLSGVNTAVVSPARQLRVHLSTMEGALDDVAARRGFASLINTEQVSRLASGRASQLEPAINPIPEGENLLPLRERASRKPLKIGVDPTDATALAAAHVIGDTLNGYGIPTEVVTERLTTITDELLPEGDVDAVITWENIQLNSFSAANIYLCDDETPLAGDLSGYCPEDHEETLEAILSGELSPRDALSQTRALNREEALYIPLMDESRVQALGKGIVGPGQSMDDWRGGLTTAPYWRADED